MQPMWSDKLLVDASVENFMKYLRKISGFGGSGFRAKEILMDVIDNITLVTPHNTARRDALRAQYMSFSVLGIGPCRVANWLFNMPYRFLEDVDPKFKETVYLPVLEYIADYLRKLQPTTYEMQPMWSRKDGGHAAARGNEAKREKDSGQLGPVGARRAPKLRAEPPPPHVPPRCKKTKGGASSGPPQIVPPRMRLVKAVLRCAALSVF